MYPSQSIKLVKDDLKHVPSLTGTEIVGMKLEPPGEKIAQSGAKKVSKARTTAELSSLLHLHISTEKWIIFVVLTAHVEARKPAIE